HFGARPGNLAGRGPRVAARVGVVLVDVGVAVETPGRGRSGEPRKRLSGLEAADPGRTVRERIQTGDRSPDQEQEPDHDRVGAGGPSDLVYAVPIFLAGRRGCRVAAQGDGQTRIRDVVLRPFSAVRERAWSALQRRSSRRVARYVLW